MGTSEKEQPGKPLQRVVWEENPEKQMGNTCVGQRVTELGGLAPDAPV